MVSYENIKTDFINNMTHEFKTPIATINLAVEAIRNPKIIVDQEKVLRYLQMIRDENKRMHAQVENVLRISKLEKNQLDLATIELLKLIKDLKESKDYVRDFRIINKIFDRLGLDLLKNDFNKYELLVS